MSSRGNGHWRCSRRAGVEVTGWRRRLLLYALIAAAFYAALLAALYTQQQRLIYPGAWRGTHDWGGIGPDYRLVETRTADGLPIRLAVRAGRSDMPTLLFFHGNGDSIEGSAQAVAPWVAAGYGAVLPEYPGYAGAPGAPSEQALYAAARAARGWMAANGIAAQDTIVVGYSIGSGVAVQMATEQRPRALVLVAPHAGLVPLVHERLPWVPADWLLSDRYDNRAKIGRVAAPILIVHGVADATIPIHFGRRLAEARPDATFLAIPDGGHEILWRADVQAKALDWMDRQASEVPGTGG